MPRYRFGPYTLSPARRLLLRDGREVPLIPRYLDLLLVLVETRRQAVDRSRIFDRVWNDVVVSDGALTQAVRTLRRALGDDPRQPRFIRTVSRHGYQFIFAPVTEEDDGAPLPAPAPAPGQEEEAPAPGMAELAGRLLAAEAEEDSRDAAEALHAAGTAAALVALAGHPGEARARAWMREARWEVPGAGPVPILSGPAPAATLLHLVRLRARRAARLAGRRWGAAAAGGALAGIAAGLVEGALFLLLEPSRPAHQPVIYATIGALVGGIGAAGVGAGLSAAEALTRAHRRAGLMVAGALGGWAVGGVANLCGRWTLEGVFGGSLAGVGGAAEGLALGAGAGLGYALATTPLAGGGMAAPRGRARWRAVILAGLGCAGAAVLITLAGGNLGGASLDLLVRPVGEAPLGLAPLGRLLGESPPALRTHLLQGGFEGLLFGTGLAAGLTRRPARGIT